MLNIRYRYSSLRKGMRIRMYISVINPRFAFFVSALILVVSEIDYAIIIKVGLC